MHFVRTSPMAQGATAGLHRTMVRLLLATGLLVLVAACEAPATDTTNKDVQDDASTDIGSLTTDVQAETDVGSDAEPATDTGPDVGPDIEPDAATDTDGAAQTDAVSQTDADNTSDTGAETGPDAAPDATGTDAQDSPDAGTSDAATGTDAVVVPACSKNSDCPQVAGGCVVAICAAGQCLPQLLPEGSACSDGNPCTASAACKGGACVALGSVACDDGQPCTADSCNTATGLCVHTPANAGVACDDGDACTQGTLCDAAGVCTGGKNACGCKSIKDCAPAEDGNPCNGTLYCNDSLPVPVCQVLPGSVVTCDASSDSTCSRNQCNPSSGQCAMTAVADGTPCDDGSSCTTEENCLAGSCGAKVNLCQCQTTNDCAGKEDSNKCNGTLYCDKSGPLFACKVNPASVVQCPKPANVCQVAACDAASGACATANAADGTACSDGNAATVGDSCQAGSCSPGAVTAECNADSDCAGKEDGNFCNGVLFCNKAEQKCQLNPKTIVTCPTVDDSTCAQNQCVPSTGLCQLKAVTDGTVCEDGNKCTAGDVCVQGQCQASADTCLCKSDSDCNAQDDGNLCNGKLYCDLQTNQCVLNPATVVYCSPAANSDCAQNQCDPKVGTCAMVPTLDGSACDDDNSCTEGEACIHGDCVGTQICACLTDTDCEDDGDLCNGTLYCDKKAGQCAVNPATVKKCPTAADTACAKNVCQPDTGACEMVAQFTGAACEADGNPCTKSDYCADGACIAGNNVCGCLTDAECAGKQGADQCVLSMYCNKETFTCQPAQSVQCDKSEDTPCSKTACNPKTGSCEQRVAADGILCGEGGLCAGVLICQDGACLAGPAVDCSDADPCTLDSCDIKQGCQYTALTASAEAPAPCDDGNVCTSSDACNLGNCVGTAKDCSDASPCTADACDPKLGCVYLPLAATACDDDNACTVADTCKDGLCKPGSEALPCSDGLQCTLDACDPQQGCVFTALSAKPCDDGSACTKSDQCVQGQCQGALVDCDDEAPCTKDSCDLVVGCQNLPLTGTACTDDNACTGPDTCSKQGTCKPGPTFLCFDGNPCTLDQCNPAAGCENPSVVGGQCDDGDGCTGNDKCLGGACQGSPVVCDDYNACTIDSCAGEGTCVFTANQGLACNDNNACTGDDACTEQGACQGVPTVQCGTDTQCIDYGCNAAGGCVSVTLDGKACTDSNPCTSVDKCEGSACLGTAIFCDDGNPCTLDGCDVATGNCTAVGSATLDGIVCNDGNFCTTTDLCDGQGACKGSGLLACNDNNACTDDLCTPGVGCTFASNAATCNDGNACTLGDKCAGGICAYTSVVGCDDNNPCTADSCNTTTGQCTSQGSALLAGIVCNDSNICTPSDTCNTVGSCVGAGALNCNDNNSCTNDTCGPTSGCIYAPNNASCSDNNACTLGDQCTGGTCFYTGTVACDDGKPCTLDACDPVSGACSNVGSASLSGVLCSDGNLCTPTDACDNNGACVGSGNLTCNDNNVCTDDSCTATGGCVYVIDNNNVCTDDNACTLSDKCVGGACTFASQKNCSDNNPCTLDNCNVNNGNCNNPGNASLNGASCTDGSLCTPTDTCNSSGVCVGSGSLTCNDNLPCTDDTCNAGSGCVFTTDDTNTCSDGNSCTLADVCVGGSCSYGSSKNCSDGNPCTLDSCNTTTGACSNVGSATLSGASCTDGSLCTPTDTCNGSGACLGSGTLACSDSNACTDDSCVAASGCSYVNDNSNTCTDGNACTQSDGCSSGTCVGTPKNCSDGNPCTLDSCDTVTGTCSNLGSAGLVGAACNDGSLCTPTDTCNVNGACVGSGTLSCNDSNDCTDDSCLPASGCNFAADNTNTCTDGNACTLLDACNSGSCVGSPKNCSDGNPCTVDSCATTTGVCSSAGSSSLNGSACNDSSLCTPTDTCNASGACIGSGALACSDSNPCTDDSCNALTGCAFASDDSNTCSDGNACTLVDKCVGGSCTFTTNKSCSDNNPCTLDNCNTSTGTCTNPGSATLNGASCTDSSLCTPTDACDSNGACIGSGSLSCSDGLSCTDDTCSGGSGCVFTPDDTNACNDGNACTLTDKCVGGSCSYTSNKNCADTNPCTLDSCNTTTGACSNVGSATLAGSSCTDGSVCTPTDGCNSSGVCVGSGSLVCNDNIECTDDSCNATAGCIATPDNSNTCSDGLLCTTPDTCSAGTCAGAAVSCNDNKVCTLDSCNSSTGACVFNAAAMNNAACSDGDACTLGDKCNGVATTCEAGGVVATCDDGKVCTTDTCIPASGCSNVANTASCDDGNVCTSGEKCASGTCGGGVPKDADGDGYVDKNCTTSNKDCDDSVATIKPGGSEICDNVDQDCDAVTDEGCDDDDDGFCDGAMTTSSGIVVVTCLGGGNDCNDVDPLINPAAQESLEPTRNGPWTSNASTGGTIVRVKIKGNRAWALLNFTDGFAAGAPRAVLATKLNGDANWVYLLPPFTADDTSLNDLAITDTAVHVVGARTVYGTGGNEYSYMMHWTSPITGAYQLRNWTATMQSDIQVGSTLRLAAGADNVVHVLGQNKYGRLATNGTWTFSTIGSTDYADLDTASDSSVHIALAADDGIYYLTDKGNLGTLTSTKIVSGSSMGYLQLALSGGDAVHVVYWKFVSGDGWSLEHIRKLASGSFTAIATLGTGQPSPADTAIAPRNNGMDLYSPAVGFRSNLDAGAVWTVIGAYNGGPVAPMAYLPRGFTGGEARLLGFDGQDAKEWTMAEGGPPTKTLMMPYYSSVRAAARQTVGMGGTLAVQTLGSNFIDPVLVPGLTRTVWFGDTLTQITSNLGVDKPVDDVANSLIDNASFVSVNAGESFYLWPNAGTVNPYPSDGLAYGFNPSSNLDTYVIPLQDGRFVVSGPKGNGDIQFVMWTPANWATYAAGGASVYQYDYVGLPIGYGTAMAGCTGANAAKALTFQCGPSGLRLIPFNTVANGHGYLEGDQVLNMAAGDCSRVWARYDSTDSSHHVFAVISGKLNYFKDVTDGSSWTQTLVSTAVVTNSAISVSSSLRGNPLVQVDGTLYDRRDGTWAATQLVVSTWFPFITTSPWQMSGFDDGDSRWGVMGSASFRNPTPMVDREEWFLFQPTNSIDQNCNGL